MRDNNNTPYATIRWLEARPYAYCLFFCTSKYFADPFRAFNLSKMIITILRQITLPRLQKCGLLKAERMAARYERVIAFYYLFYSISFNISTAALWQTRMKRTYIPRGN